MNPVTFVYQVRDELTKVSWPKRKDVISMTAIVLGVSLAIGLYIGGLDSIFTAILDSIIRT